MRNEIAVILRHADEVLQTARLGYFDLSGLNSVRQSVGLRNLIEFSQLFYVVLQSMEAEVDERQFKNWYKEQQDMAKSDPVMSFFTALSDEIAELEEIPAFISLSQKFSAAEISRLGRPPVGATGFFIGDNSNGSGWIIGLSGDCEGRYFMELPEGIGTLEQSVADSLLLENTALRTRSIQGLCSDYLNKLEKVLASACKTFALAQFSK